MTLQVFKIDRTSGNATGVLAMLVSMAAFVANDTCVKLIGSSMPLGELIALRNAFSTIYILIFAAIFGGMTLPVKPPGQLLTWRMVAELLSTLFFLSGLIALPIAEATAISQLAPLALTAAAAIFLKERVGWLQWLATVCGLAGVLLIIQPGTEAFSPAALFILASVAFIVVRDLMTRAIPIEVPTLTLTAMSASVSILAGFILWPFETWLAPSMQQIALLMLAAFFLAIAYALIVIAIRSGDIGVVSPFRYAVIVFAIISGWAIWGNVPNAVQLTGITMLTIAGIYVMHRGRAPTP